MESNIELYRKHIIKSKLLGRNDFEYVVYPFINRVIIIKYINNDRNTVVKIGDFVTDIERGAFSGCNKSLKVIMSRGNIDSLDGMFESYKGSKLDLSEFDTSNIRSMADMFRDCTLLRKLVLGSFDTRHVENMSNMFYNCGALKELDLSRFDISRVKSTQNIFYGCKLLKRIKYKQF